MILDGIRAIIYAAGETAVEPVPVNPVEAVSSSAASGGDVVSSAVVSGAEVITSASDIGGGSSHVGTIIWLCILAFALIMIAFEFIRSRYVLSVTHREVVLDDLPEAFDGTRIAVVSDLHQMRFGDFNEELAKHIRREFPDYIFFAGDMGDVKEYNVDAFYDLLDSLGSDIPLIMVPGRDDLRIGGGTVHRNFRREVEHAGGLLLNNSCAELLSGKSKLYVYGFCAPLEQQEDLPVEQWDYAPVGEKDIPAMLGRCPSDAPVLLLAHDPSNFEAYSKWGAQLVLCGHTHGGIVRVPHFGGVFPVDSGKLFPEYTGGQYEMNDSRMIVTRGLGSTKGVRFLNAPEISVITLSLPESRKPVVEKVEEEVMEEKNENTMTFAEKAKSQAAIVSDWAKGEARSIRELLYERSIQIRDFFGLMFGKKRSRFAKAADEKKRRNTYVAPKKSKKQIPDRSRNGGRYMVKPAKRIEDENESFGTNYDTTMRTDLDDERSDLFRRVDRFSDDRPNKKRK
ncbi:MAG: metallophosphoesterase [Ruminococcaceae bacterium]|nr:metallophosphoesterase [Oscillospiraceae bacterium]